MNKYIDADLLRKEINKWTDAMSDNIEDDYSDGVRFALNHFVFVLESLQQEQQVLPGIEDPGIPGKDFIPVEWVDACEMYGKWKIVKQDQPVLPDNLDDVAKQLYPIITEEAKSDEWKIANREYNDMCIKLQDAFRKGAEWMAERAKKQEQREVDLEEEIQLEWDSFNRHLAEYVDEREEVIWLNWNSFADVARNFYELGLNTKKEK